MLADLLLVVHFLIALFITLGLPAIWLGGLLDWAWVRNLSFRAAHLGAIILVAAEALLGIACPLTVWEDALRGTAPGEAGFIERLVRRALYYDFSPWVFTVAYVLFALLVLLTWRVFPPRARRDGSQP